MILAKANVCGWRLRAMWFWEDRRFWGLRTAVFGLATCRIIALGPLSLRWWRLS